MPRGIQRTEAALDDTTPLGHARDGNDAGTTCGAGGGGRRSGRRGCLRQSRHGGKAERQGECSHQAADFEELHEHTPVFCGISATVGQLACGERPENIKEGTIVCKSLPMSVGLAQCEADAILSPDKIFVNRQAALFKKLF